MNWKQIEELKYLLEQDGLQSVLDTVAILLEEQTGDQGIEQMQETFLICECLRNFNEKCRGSI